MGDYEGASWGFGLPSTSLHSGTWTFWGRELVLGLQGLPLISGFMRTLRGLVGFRGLGFRGLGFRGLGFRGLGFRGLGVRV